MNGAGGVSWPGRTIERNVADDPLEVKWENNVACQPGTRYSPHTAGLHVTQGYGTNVVTLHQSRQ